MEAKSLQVEELVNRCETLKHERKDLREDVLNVREQCSHLQSQLDKESREKENLKDELNEAIRKVRRREDEIENLAKKLQEQGEILEKGSRRSREDQGQIRLVKQELETHVENYEEKCRELETVRAKFEGLQQDYDGKKKEVTNAISAVGRLKNRVSKLEREKVELAAEVENRGNNMTKQSGAFTKLQKQLKETKESLANSQQQVDELLEQGKTRSDDNRALFKQLTQKNSNCVELETNLKELQSSKNSLAREVKKLEGKCEELEKQTEEGFREKLKLTEEMKAQEEIKQRASNEVTRLKEQVKEYKNLYETNLKDSVARKNSHEKKSHQNEELHKKLSKKAVELSEVEKRLEEARVSNAGLKKECFMKQAKVAKLEELLQKTMQENKEFNEIEKEFGETREELQQRNEEVEDYEVEVQKLKLRICELEALNATLEKSNVVLKVSDENDRVEESLKKLSELEKTYQKTSLEKQALELQLTEAKSLLTESETQSKEMANLEKELQRSEQELSDMEFQHSILKKENKSLKENTVQLNGKLNTLEAEKAKLINDLKQTQGARKTGYSRGGLFIDNSEVEATKPRPDVTSSLPVGPQTSTPLTSPRVADPLSRSLEVVEARTEPELERKCSPDASYVGSTQPIVSWRLRTSSDNLTIDRDWPRPSTLSVESIDKGMHSKTADMSFEGLVGGRASNDWSNVRAMIRQLEKPSPPEKRDITGLGEDWETISNASSAAWTMDDTVLTDLEADPDVDTSDTASVKSLKLQFEASVKPPSKLTRKHSNLTKTPSLSALVEKQEESTTNTDVGTIPSDIFANIPNPNATSSGTDTRPSEVDVKNLDSDKSLPDSEGKHAYIEMENTSQNPESKSHKFDVISRISDVERNVVVDSRVRYTEAGLKSTSHSQLWQEEDKSGNKLNGSNPETNQTVDVKVKVKDMKTLWDKKTVDSQKNEGKGGQLSESGVKKTDTVRLNTSTAGSAEDHSRISGEVPSSSADIDSTETTKQTKVSDLVHLWNKSN